MVPTQTNTPYVCVYHRRSGAGIQIRALVPDDSFVLRMIQMLTISRYRIWAGAVSSCQTTLNISKSDVLWTRLRKSIATSNISYLENPFGDSVRQQQSWNRLPFSEESKAIAVSAGGGKGLEQFSLSLSLVNKLFQMSFCRVKVLGAQLIPAGIARSAYRVLVKRPPLIR